MFQLYYKYKTVNTVTVSGTYNEFGRIFFKPYLLPSGLQLERGKKSGADTMQ